MGTAGLPGCEAGKFLLDVADVLLDRDGFQGGLVGGEFGFLCGAEGPARKEPLAGGAWLVVEPFAGVRGCRWSEVLSSLESGLGFFLMPTGWLLMLDLFDAARRQRVSGIPAPSAP